MKILGVTADGAGRGPGAVDRAAEWHRSHPFYRVLAAASLPRLMRASRSGARVFCFHNVVPGRHAAPGDASLHMPSGQLEELLDWVRTAYRVVPLSELLERTSSNGPARSVRGLAVLTFDDAYMGFFDHGMPVLSRFSLPATVFVVSAAATRPEPFWWDVLAAGSRLSAEDRRRHLDDNRGVATEVLQDGAAAHPAAQDALPPDLLPAPWWKVRDALRGQDLVTVGSHTATHPNLTRSRDGELEAELTRSRERIGEALDVEVDVVSYPYGLHDGRVREAAARAGYRAGLTLDTGLARPGGDPLAMPRLNVPARIGVEALECWAAGLGPRRPS